MIYGMAGTDLGTRIRRAREAKGYSQQELADRMPRRPDGRRSASIRSVGRWERGEAVPRSALGALQEVLRPFFTANGSLPAPPSDPRERELWDLLIAEDFDEPAAWAVIEEYRRRKQHRPA